MFISTAGKRKKSQQCRWSSSFGLLCFLVVSHVFGGHTHVLAQAANNPSISFQVSGMDATEPWTFGLRILFMLTVLTLAPALLMLVTSFTRVVIVLGLLRTGPWNAACPSQSSHDWLSLISDAFHHDAGVGTSAN